MSRRRYDTIVVGVGAMGSAACYHLARRGRRVLGLEHYGVPNDMGSSHGINRIIRLAYYEHPAYVPLLRRAYTLWRRLEVESGESLLHVTGSIDASAPDDEIIRGALHACALHDIPHVLCTSTELALRYPGFRLPKDHLALFQPDGGFLASDKCIAAHARLAQAAGAEIHAQERVLGWDLVPGGVCVRTVDADYEADRVIVSAGAWLGELLPSLQAFARPERQVLGWFEPLVPEYFEPASFPVFNVSVEEGRYYGFPVFGIPGFKVGRYHHLEEQIDTPDTWNREPGAADEAVLREFTERYFPEAAGPLLNAQACMFTNAPDGHFIVDTLPGEERVIVASPCSGHGFKFSAVIGEILADLATDGTTRHDIGLFRLARLR